MADKSNRGILPPRVFAPLRLPRKLCHWWWRRVRAPLAGSAGMFWLSRRIVLGCLLRYAQLRSFPRMPEAAQCIVCEVPRIFTYLLFAGILNAVFIFVSAVFLGSDKYIS
ncbi:MAG: hypothetical protein Ta2A_19220 [Treponemataceae bacterium]|nr:MAG: hypothetical protein Ta2A_19220 [Treponemataceae bacterium]